MLRTNADPNNSFFKGSGLGEGRWPGHQALPWLWLFFFNLRLGRRKLRPGRADSRADLGLRRQGTAGPDHEGHGESGENPFGRLAARSPRPRHVACRCLAVRLPGRTTHAPHCTHLATPAIKRLMYLCHREPSQGSSGCSPESPAGSVPRSQTAKGSGGERNGGQGRCWETPATRHGRLRGGRPSLHAASPPASAPPAPAQSPVRVSRKPRPLVVPTSPHPSPDHPPCTPDTHSGELAPCPESRGLAHPLPGQGRDSFLPVPPETPSKFLRVPHGGS